MPGFWDKVVSFLREAYRRLKLIDWIGAAFAILKASKKEDLEVDPKYIIIKPRILSDENLLRGVATLKTVVAFIPPAAIAAPILSLGAMGFKIWKRIALAADYDRIQYPPMDPNMLRLSIDMDPQLSKHYGHLTSADTWNDESISEAEELYNDFQFLTDFEMLRAKYPHMDEGYLRTRVQTNRDNLQVNLSAIEQGFLQVSASTEIEHGVREGFAALKELFPVMNDWALFNSEGFDDLVGIIDTVF